MSGLSSVYETDPVGYEEQPRFLNLAAEVRTGLEPSELLHRCQEVENRLGRVRSIRWGPRTIDIDLLLFGDHEIETAELTIPHPRMAERAFVLEPLAEIAPDLRVGRTSIQELLERLRKEGGQGIALYAPTGDWMDGGA